MARSISDSARILKLARSSRDVVAIAMGEIGLPARVLALREGSALAYAPVAAATAPGQIPLRDLKGLYRAHELTRATRVYGVIGNPVGHSLSPLLHNTGYIAAGKRCGVFAVPGGEPEGFSEGVAGFWRAGIQRDLAAQGKNIRASG